VMGRKIEEAMLHVAIKWASSAGAREVYASYRQTLQSKPCYDFFQNSGLTCDGGNMFRWNTAEAYPFPGVIRLVCDGGNTFKRTSSDIDSPDAIISADRLHDGEINVA